MRGVIFAYHSQNCGGYDYSSNNHLALAQDLRTVAEYGLPIISLATIATKFTTRRIQELPKHFVAFSCDDGSLLDWHDYDHPEFGPQRSFANILREHVRDQALSAKNLLTAFVIASPAARKAIDEGCYAGEPLSGDDWWSDAAEEGLVAIENHSWDHLHAVLPQGMIQHGEAGSFYTIDNYDKADSQVRRAADTINRLLASSGRRTSLFAYPYGHMSPYLSEQYLPRFQDQHGVVAAFTTEQKYVDETSSPYALPRLVCGDAWRTREQFEGVLQRLIED